jgi:hypothetical protein
LQDWNLARDYGEFLIGIGPEQVIGHALVARASRHLGNLDRAREELEQCRILPKLPAEKDLFVSFVAQEERLLFGEAEKAEPDNT